MSEEKSKQQVFLELAKKTEQMYDDMKAAFAELKTAMEALDVGTYVQDPETLLVYKIIEPTGTFVEFRTIDYKRTAKEGERGGTVLSKKEAEEAGFVLKKA